MTKAINKCSDIANLNHKELPTGRWPVFVPTLVNIDKTIINDNIVQTGQTCGSSAQIGHTLEYIYFGFHDALLTKKVTSYTRLTLTAQMLDQVQFTLWSVLTCCHITLSLKFWPLLTSNHLRYPWKNKGNYLLLELQTQWLRLGNTIQLLDMLVALDVIYQVQTTMDHIWPLISGWRMTFIYSLRPSYQ